MHENPKKEKPAEASWKRKTTGKEGFAKEGGERYVLQRELVKPKPRKAGVYERHY